MRFLQSYALFGMTILAFMLFLSTPAHAQCASPVGAAGDMTYNDNDEVVQWCDGSNWNGINTPPYIPNAVNFDGVSDHLVENPPTIYPDTDRATGSFWFKMSATGSVGRIYRTLPTDVINMEKQSSDTLRITFETGTNGERVFRATAPGVSDNAWHHALFSFDNSDGNFHFYVDDAAIAPSSNFTGSVPLTTAVSHHIGSSSVGGSNLFDGELADFWIDFDTYIDLSDVNNRRKFIDANGWPVDLGTDGSRPTGSSPDIFLSGDTATWHTNDGTGGGFTENGALTDANSHPAEYFGPLDGLLAWWKFDETTGTIVNDSSNNGHNGSMVNGLNADDDSINGMIDSAFYMNNNGHVFIPYDPALELPGDFTISTWTKPNTTASGFYGRTIFDLKSAYVAWKWDDTLEKGCFFMMVIGPGGWPGDQFNGCGASIYDLNKWYNIVMVNSANTFNLYINNSLYYTRSLPSYSGLSGDDFRIGTWQPNNRSYTGVIDDFRIYDSALSAAEITELYDTGFPCKNPTAQRGGDIMYNSTHHVPQYCNNREWRAMGAGPGDGGAGCANPTGEAGDFNYNTTSNVMTYCEGDEWRAVAY